MRWIEVWKIEIFAESEFVDRSNKNATSFAMVSRTASVKPAMPLDAGG